MTRRYVFYAGVMELSVIGEKIRQEIWMGIEAEDVDIEKFSREHGFDLIAADGMSAAELRSIGVTKFQLLDDIADDSATGPGNSRN